MSGAERMVNCCDHGEVRAAFVCTHTVEALREDRPKGFFWTRDDVGCVNAWCDDCEAMLEKCGGAWNDESEAYAQIKLICELCAKRAAEMNGIKELAQ